MSFGILKSSNLSVTKKSKLWSSEDCLLLSRLILFNTSIPVFICSPHLMTLHQTETVVSVFMSVANQQELNFNKYKWGEEMTAASLKCMCFIYSTCPHVFMHFNSFLHESFSILWWVKCFVSYWKHVFLLKYEKYLTYYKTRFIAFSPLALCFLPLSWLYKQ